MQKHYQERITRLTDLKNGITQYAARWTDAPASMAGIDTIVTELNAKDTSIEQSEDALRIQRQEGKTLREQADAEIERLERTAIGIHADDKENLIFYNIKERKEAEPREKPSAVLSLKIAYDTDGIGFILSWNRDELADHYLLERGESAIATDTNTVPDNFKVIKSSKKVSYIDDEVEKGLRYWYKVTAVNPKGEGPASAPVSAVQ